MAPATELGMVNRVVHIDCLLQRQVLPAPPSSSILPTGVYSSGIYINGAWHVWSGRSRRDGEAVRDQPVRPLGRAQLLMLSNLPLATVGLLLLPCLMPHAAFMLTSHRPSSNASILMFFSFFTLTQGAFSAAAAAAVADQLAAGEL